MVRLSGLFRELRRRNVFRAVIAYVVGAWVGIEIADILLRAFDAPGWILQALLIVVALALPAVLAFSWFYEITPAGIIRTEATDADDSDGRIFDRRFDFAIISLLVGALALSLYANIRGPEEPPESVSILIADIDNRSGSDLFTGVLEETLRIGLEVAPFVDVFSRKNAAAIAASLADTDRAAGSLPFEAAGLVALREGIDVIIGGSVSRSDRGLTVSVTGITPGFQQELFDVTETAADDADMLNAIALVSKKLRLELGDTEKPGDAGQNESFAVANLEAAAEYLKAQDLQRDRKLEDAVGHYQKALEFDPEFARAYAGLALTEQYLGRMEAASRHWREALSRLHTVTERGQLRTLGVYYTTYQRDYRKALETFERLVQRFPADNVAHNNLAVAAFYSMDFDRALEVGREVAVRFPKHSGYRANLALYAMYAGQFDEAAQVAHDVIRDDPSNVYAFTVTALTQAVAGDFTAADVTYRRMLELDQFGRSIAPEGIADLAIYRGDLNAAVEVLDRAIEEAVTQNSNHSAALKRVMRAQALLGLGEHDKARASIDLALQFSNDDPAILVPAALLLAEIGEIGRAEAIAAEMSDSISNTRLAYANAIRAWIADIRDQPDAAIGHANAAIETSDLWLIRFMRARIYLQHGLIAEATADLQLCERRIGEGIAVFLNDRPSYRLIRDLRDVIASLPSGDRVATSAP
ncbi:MAG: tetratricopeptide repeat protein [Woeseia sp.]